ncbi:hypothetical protein OPQ81_011021 [Rhizoctonia solani]|nr:hypothetical protein OPQ81_011021 [Rhizoctonia solani]
MSRGRQGDDTIIPLLSNYSLLNRLVYISALNKIHAHGYRARRGVTWQESWQSFPCNDPRREWMLKPSSRPTEAPLGATCPCSKTRHQNSTLIRAQIHSRWLPPLKAHRCIAFNCAQYSPVLSFRAVSHMHLFIAPIVPNSNAGIHIVPLVGWEPKGWLYVDVLLSTNCLHIPLFLNKKLLSVARWIPGIITWHCGLSPFGGLLSLGHRTEGP